MTRTVTAVETLMGAARASIDRARTAARAPGTDWAAVELSALRETRSRLLTALAAPDAYDTLLPGVAHAMRANDEAALTVLDERIQLLETTTEEVPACGPVRVRALVDVELPGSCPAPQNRDAIVSELRHRLPEWVAVAAVHIVDRTARAANR